ncbi:MAG: hypothetical protein LBD41_04255 [Clostridiales Family XIII bacterium]|jgi:hypothetical protein|nr:hypothetical protein [Clostridiales Family XIII bacterium]
MNEKPLNSGRGNEKIKTISNSPILRQKPASLFLGVSIPMLMELEKSGIVKRHELKRESGKSLPFYIKDELVEAIRSM